MSRPSPSSSHSSAPPSAQTTLDSLLEAATPLDARLELLTTLRRANGSEIDRLMLSHIDAQAEALSEMQEVNTGLQELAAKLTAPPLQEGRVLEFSSGPEGMPLVRVASGGTERYLTFDVAEGEADLTIGDRVFLTQQGNAILGRATGAAGIKNAACTANADGTASAEGDAEPGVCVPVVRWLGSRLIVKDHDEELVVRVASSLTPECVKPGDCVRLDRNAAIALEVVEGGHAEPYTRQAALAALPPEALAGYDALRDSVLKRISYVIAHPELAQRYGIARDNARLLLEGPPGCGKSLFARVIAWQVQKLSGTRCQVARINGAELFSPYVGETERNIRRLIGDLAADPQVYTVLFLDEVDAIATMRGVAGNVHADRFLGTLLSEIEGFGGRARVFFVAATNRLDVLDRAFRDRFAWHVHVGPPKMAAARAIFARHLPVDLPYPSTQAGSSPHRLRLIESALAHLYAPNGAGASIATVRLRDGKTRTVEARELISGRLIEQICQEAREQAFQREIEEGGGGICDRDMQIAVAGALERLRTTLTVTNVHGYLSGLPQDVGVVAVEPAPRVPLAAVYLH